MANKLQKLLLEKEELGKKDNVLKTEYDELLKNNQTGTQGSFVLTPEMEELSKQLVVSANNAKALDPELDMVSAELHNQKEKILRNHILFKRAYLEAARAERAIWAVSRDVKEHDLLGLLIEYEDLCVQKQDLFKSLKKVQKHEGVANGEKELETLNLDIKKIQAQIEELKNTVSDMNDHPVVSLKDLEMITKEMSAAEIDYWEYKRAYSHRNLETLKAVYASITQVVEEIKETQLS